jgi:RNA polymerase II subunit A small phosphatase-like protein
MTHDRILLVLDLDETLVFGTESKLDRPPDLVTESYFVYFRPGLQDFVARVSKLFRLAVWTSASRRYALKICEVIFPKSTSLEFIWASERCTTVWDYETGRPCGAKRLKKLRKRYSLERVLMVDDSPEKHARNFGNLVHVNPFEGDPNDRELSSLAIYLETLAACDNVRRIEKRGWHDQVKRMQESGSYRPNGTLDDSIHRLRQEWDRRLEWLKPSGASLKLKRALGHSSLKGKRKIEE